MEFVAGFVVGYFLKNFLTWLDDFATPKVPDNYYSIWSLKDLID
jgi:hypothetical protein